MFKKAVAALSIGLIILTLLSTSYAGGDTLKSATEYDYPPFSVTSDGVADGFSVELLKAVAEAEGLEINFKIGEWVEIKDELAQGGLDVLPFVAYSEERDEYLDFSVPYIIIQGNIFVRSDNTDIKSEKDLYGKEIIVMRGDSAHEYAEKKGFSDELYLTETFTDAFKLLASGQHDAVVAQGIMGATLIKQLNIKNVKPVSPVATGIPGVIKSEVIGFEQKFCFAVKSGNHELLAKLNEGLAVVNANGTFNELYNKWLNPSRGTLSFWQAVESLLAFIVPALILILVFAVIYIKYQVSQKKRELEKSNNALLMLEAHLIQKQKLESIGVLASGVAHEINNPLNGIMNYSQIINDSAKNTEDDLEESREQINVFSNEILEETRRISDIVSNLLSFSRTEKKSHSRAEVGTIIDGVLTLVSVIIKRNDINLELDIAEGLPSVDCRTQQIQQVLINLISNAKDALNTKYPGHDDNKKIILSAKFIESKNKPLVRITVEDHGPGIPKEVQNRIFDPFFTTKERSEGTGLGLSISYNIASEHGGELSYETKEGEYTRFHLDLPPMEIGEEYNDT